MRKLRGRSLRAFVIGFVAIVAVGLVILNLPRRSGGLQADPKNPTLVAQGQQIYLAQCATCHGANLEGQPNWQQELPTGGRPAPPHDATGHTWHHPDELLIDIMTNGGAPKSNSTMLGFKDLLTPNEIDAILDFIKSRWGREEREYQWWMTAVGAQQ